MLRGGKSFPQHLDFIAATYAELDLEDPEGLYHTRTTENVRILFLCQQLSGTEYSAIAYEYHRAMTLAQRYDFHEYIRQLINYYTHLEQGRRSTATIHARMVNTGPTMHRPPDRGYQPRYNNRQNQGDRNPSMFLSSVQHAYFMAHAPSVLERFKALRTEVNQIIRACDQQQRGNTPQGPAPPTVNPDQPQKLEHQYSSGPPAAHVNFVAHDSNSVHDLDSFHGHHPTPDDTDDDNGIYVSNDDDAYNRLAQNIRAQMATSTPPPGDVTITHSNAGRTIDLRSCSSVMAFRLRATDAYVSTPDGGADTMILGRGWVFTDFYPNRTVNIVGFDERHARRRDCRIGVACAVMRSADGVDYLMIAHEAVQNHDSFTSLLSEAQMRHRGLIVDSTSVKHLGVNKEPGTQSIQFPDEGICFNMQQRSALMVIPHREPTTTEMDTLPRLALTSSEIWTPHTLFDDPDAIRPVDAFHTRAS